MFVKVYSAHFVLLQLKNWIYGPGEKWLLTLHEIGENKDEADELYQGHLQLEQKSQVRVHRFV